MILTIAQTISCLFLSAVALSVSRGSVKARPFLIPLIIISSVLGIAALYPYAIEIFVANYSGAIYEMESLGSLPNVPYRWIYYGSAILPLLPALALIPQIKRRLLVVATLALLGMVPAAFFL